LRLELDECEPSGTLAMFSPTSHARVFGQQEHLHSGAESFEGVERLPRLFGVVMLERFVEHQQPGGLGSGRDSSGGEKVEHSLG
jgi:hypothetical protein